MQFDYFYPEQADQYAFYRIPRRLFTDSNFKELTTEAKILYGLMLDRVSEYYGAAEPPVRCGESHLSGLTEPPRFV